MTRPDQITFAEIDPTWRIFEAEATLLAGHLGDQMARRRWQEGTVQLRHGLRNDVWVGRWREDFINADGTISRRCCKEVLGTKRELPTKRLAIRELAKRLAPINSTDYRPLRPECFSDFAEWWKVNVLSKHKLSTQSSIASQLRTALVPFFGKMMLRDIQWQTIQSFVTHCTTASAKKKAAAPKTIKNYILTLQMVWKSARAASRVTHNPFEALILPKVGRQRRFSFTAEEIKLILSKAVEPYLTFYWLAAESGLRAGELCGLRIADLDLDNCGIDVVQSAWRSQLQDPKTANSIRKLAISPQLAEHLRRYLMTWRPNTLNLVFATSRGNPWAPCNVMRSNLHPLLDSLGLPRCGLHAFRHGNASLMNHLKAPLKTQQERLGHAPGSNLTLAIYTHSLTDDDRAIASQLGEKLRPVASKTGASETAIAPQSTMIQ
jgi:integrase